MHSVRCAFHQVDLRVCPPYRDSFDETNGVRVADKERIEANLPLVKKIAGEVYRSIGRSMDIADLIAYGTQGLIEALDRFDPKRGFTFSTFAYYRVRGAVWDGVRTMGWRARGQSARFAQAADLVLQQAHEDAPASGSTGEAAAVERAITQVAAAFVVTLDDDRLARTASTGPDAEAELGRAMEATLLRGVLLQLPDKERALIESMYFEDKSLTDAGAAIGLSKSWACRLHARALKLLAEALAEKGLHAPQHSGG